jgi:hypothetical protein
VIIADTNNGRVRKVDMITMKISTIAGGGYSRSGLSAGLATSEQLYSPRGVAVDKKGNIAFVDQYSHTVRMVNTSGIIFTVAGVYGSSGYDGDGIQANKARLNYPVGVAFDSEGNVLIADSYNQRVRMVNVTTGIILTVAGNGNYYNSDPSGLATSTAVYYPIGVAVDARSGQIYICSSNSIRVVNKFKLPSAATPFKVPTLLIQTIAPISLRLEWNGVDNFNNDLQIFAGLNVSAKRNMISLSKVDSICHTNLQLDSFGKVRASADGRLQGISSNNFTVTLQKASINIGDSSDSRAIQFSSGSRLAVNVPMSGNTGMIAINASAVDSNKVSLFNTIDSLAWDVADVNQYLYLAIVSQFKGGKGGSTSWNIEQEISYGSKPSLPTPQMSLFPSGNTMDSIIFIVIYYQSNIHYFRSISPALNPSSIFDSVPIYASLNAAYSTTVCTTFVPTTISPNNATYNAAYSTTVCRTFVPTTISPNNATYNAAYSTAVCTTFVATTISPNNATYNATVFTTIISTTVSLNNATIITTVCTTIVATTISPNNATYNATIITTVCTTIISTTVSPNNAAIITAIVSPIKTFKSPIFSTFKTTIASTYSTAYKATLFASIITNNFTSDQQTGYQHCTRGL